MKRTVRVIILGLLVQAAALWLVLGERGLPVWGPDSGPDTADPPSQQVSAERRALQQVPSGGRSPLTTDGDAAAGAEQEPAVPRVIKLVALGDSLTEGYGDDTGPGGYVPMLRERLQQAGIAERVVAYNWGVYGHRTMDLLERLERPDVRSSVEEADRIVVTIGGNDVMHVVQEYYLELGVGKFDEERPRYEQRLHDVLGTLRQLNPSSPLYLLGIFNPFAKWFGEDFPELDVIVSEWNAASQAVAESFDNVFFVAVQDLFVSPDVELLYDDQFHPNEEGYRRMAERVSAVMLEQEERLRQ